MSKKASNSGHSDGDLKDHRRSPHDRNDTQLGSDPDPSPPESHHTDWRALSYMLVSLVAALVLALAHHFMNSYLDQKPVAKVLIPQEWISRVATVLSYLNRMFLVITVGIAFVQHQWLILHRTPLRLKDIDSLMTILSDLVPFLTSSVWFKQPVLTLIALISWTIPLTAIITPGTLSIAPLPRVDVEMVKVAQLAFDLYNEGSYSSDTNFIWADEYAIKRLFNNAATASQYPQIPSAFPNQSYSLEFQGPALQCNPANETFTKEFADFFNGGAPAGGWGYYLAFAAWTGDTAYDRGQIVGWSNWWLNLVNFTSHELQPDLRPLETIDISDDAYHIFIATNQKTTNATRNDPFNVTECQLYNATYSAHFDFQYPNQVVKASILEYHKPVLWTSIQSLNDSRAAYFESKNASFITGSADGLTTDDLVHQAPMSSTMIYSTMMKALADILVGFQQGQACNIEGYPGLLDNCDFSNNGAVFFTQKHLLHIDWLQTESIKRGLEEVFTNATVSFFAQPKFTKSLADADYVPSTVTTYPISYVYNARDLLLAYGIALGASALCVLIGFQAVRKNNASYQNLCSTFIRATSGTDVGRLIDKNDNGADPLPKNVGNIMVTTSARQRHRAAEYAKHTEYDVLHPAEKSLPRVIIVDNETWI